MDSPVSERLTWLHSGRFHERWARGSLRGWACEAWRVWAVAGGGFVGERLSAEGSVLATRAVAEPFEVLRFARDSGGVWAGYVGYEAGRSLEAALDVGRDTLGWPLLQVQRLDRACWEPAGRGEAARVPAGGWRIEGLRPTVDEERYQSGVDDVVAAIRRGDLFQANLTYALEGSFSGCAASFYGALAGVSPAWYGGLIALLGGSDEPERVLATVSPELFLSFEGRRMTTRPIKGTSGVGEADGLLASSKDAAELHMIVDVLRNDLGRSATIGTVRVEEARHAEEHPTVTHGVATVTAELRGGVDWVEALRLASPGGSITGAPKVEAMKLIDRLEPAWRGPYCGSIGWFEGDRACWNVGIRTAAITKDRERDAGRIRYGVGGGIVADSEPAAEWRETLLKAAALWEAIRGCGGLAPSLAEAGGIRADG